MKCLAKQPEERFKSARELAEALQKLGITKQTISASNAVQQQTSASPSAKVVAKLSLKLLGMLFYLLLLIVMLAITIYLEHHSEYAARLELVMPNVSSVWLRQNYLSILGVLAYIAVMVNFWLWRKK